MSNQAKAALITLGLTFGLLMSCSGGGGSSSSTPSVPTPPVIPPTSGANTNSEADVTYATGSVNGGASLIDLKLNIIQPTGICTGNRPYAILIHGGGFTGGDKGNENLSTVAMDLAERGYPSLSINYRLAGDDPIPGAQYQPIADQLIAGADMAGLDEDPRRLNAIASAFEDTVKAMEWAIANSTERCLDSDNFILLGSSAGAITALDVAYALDDFDITIPPIQAVVSISGDLFFKDTLAPDEPPFIMINGTLDETTTIENSDLVAAEASQKGLQHTYYRIDGAGHGFGGVRLDVNMVNGNTLREVMYAFIEAHLVENGTPLYETQTLSNGG